MADEAKGSATTEKSNKNQENKSNKSKGAKANTSQATSKPAKQEKKAKPSQKKPNVFQRFMAYLKNVQMEIKRTSWPNRNEVGRMSLIVIGALVFFGVTIFAIDFAMTQLLSVVATMIPGESPLTLAELLDRAAGILGAN